MTQSAETAVVQREITVKATPARAFEFFTSQMARWWPEKMNIAGVPFSDVVMEPHPGGRFFERAANGSECDWGRVLVWEPPARVVLGWHLNPQWQFDPDPAHASEVEVRFEALGPQTTQVVLVHSGFERHGEGFDSLLKSVGSPGGWTLILDTFRDQLATA
jgi:uncharacterized protein YndB with AHSA1/START domain